MVINSVAFARDTTIRRNICRTAIIFQIVAPRSPERFLAGTEHFSAGKNFIGISSGDAYRNGRNLYRASSCIVEEIFPIVHDIGRKEIGIKIVKSRLNESYTRARKHDGRNVML